MVWCTGYLLTLMSIWTTIAAQLTPECALDLRLDTRTNECVPCKELCDSLEIRRSKCEILCTVPKAYLHCANGFYVYGPILGAAAVACMIFCGCLLACKNRMDERIKSVRIRKSRGVSSVDLLKPLQLSDSRNLNAVV